MKFYHFLLLLVAVSSLSACSASKGSMKALIKDAEFYHQDLLFDRFEIAAKNIAPASRADWLESVQSQNLHFTEIEIMSAAECNEDSKDKDKNNDSDEKCVILITQQQWYVSGSTSVNSARVFTTWVFNEDDKKWFIVEQIQK